MGVFDKSCGKHSAQLWSCLKLASKRYYVNLPKLVCVVNNIQEIRFAVLDKTFKKQSAQQCCCSKLAPNHTVQLSFCFKLARIIRKQKLVTNSAQLYCCPKSASKTPCATVVVLEIVNYL